MVSMRKHSITKQAESIFIMPVLKKLIIASFLKFKLMSPGLPFFLRSQRWPKEGWRTRYLIWHTFKSRQKWRVVSHYKSYKARNTGHGVSSWNRTPCVPFTPTQRGISVHRDERSFIRAGKQATGMQITAWSRRSEGSVQATPASSPVSFWH